METPHSRGPESLTRREQDVLELMALGLMNREIAQRLSLSPRTVETHIWHVLDKLGAPNRARAVIGATHSGLLRGVSGGTEVRPGNLPFHTTSFVGRETELREIAALIGKTRLVTIVGAGGVGKTRLATQLGLRSWDTFSDGVWLADLAKVSGDDSVVREIASTFSVKSLGFRTLLDHLLTHLKLKRLLLIIDNCEHVIDEAAHVAEEIVQTCEFVTVLATSRERLGLQSEHIYRLPALDVPPQYENLSVENALKVSAVELFVDRASAVDARFNLTEANSRTVGEICRRLDGLALAIELAAARITALSTQELLDRLREQLRLLTGTGRAAYPHHKTMRAALDWSYEWLSEAEQALFRRLAIFQGGWTIDTIAAAGVSELFDEFGLLDALSSLVDKSLVAAELRGNAQRYRLMEPLRQYGLEMLREHGELDAVSRSHAEYFAEFSRREGGKWLQVPDPIFIATIEAEIDNVRAALEWALARGNDRVLGAEIASALGYFWFTQHYHEGLGWLEAAQAAVSYQTHPSLSVWIAIHRMRAYAQRSMNEVVLTARDVLAPARALGDELALRRLLMLLGSALVQLGRLDEVEPILKEGLDLSERAADPHRLTYILFGLTRLYRKRGDDDAARAFSMRMAEVHERAHLPGDRNRWLILTELASEAEHEGRVDHAIKLCREAYECTQVTKDVLGGLQAEYLLGALLLRAASTDEARTHGHALLKVSAEELLPHGVAPAIQLLAGVATQCGKHKLAAHLLGFSEAHLLMQTGKELFADVDPEWFRQALRDHFGSDALAVLMAEGAAWPEGRAVSEALSV